MEHLALAPTPSRFETPTSYLSRVAARNFCSSLKELCFDVGLDLTLLSTGSAEALSQVTQLTGLRPNFFDHTVVIKTSSMKYRVGDEAMDIETLARGDVWVCPSCVANTLARGGELWDVVHHHHWQVRQIERCVTHGCKLLRLQPWVVGNVRLDATKLIRDNLQEILHAATNTSSSEKADEVDAYLTQRFNGLKSSCWCDVLHIPALYRAGEALGTLLLHDRKTTRPDLSACEKRSALLRGFQVLADGPNSIREALAKFTSCSPRNSTGLVSPQYGEIQRLLRSRYVTDANLEPLRDVVFEYFLDNYPMTPGSEILGRLVPARKLHSMRSAMRELNLRQEFLEEILVERGAGSHDNDGKFRLKQKLTVELVSEMKREQLRFVNGKQATRYLGTTEDMFRKLVKRGVFRPCKVNKKRTRKGFDRNLLDAFLKKVFRGTQKLPCIPQRARLLTYATRCVNCSVPDIITLILEGKLQAVGRMSEELTLKSLLIDIDELKAALPQQDRNGYTFNEAQRLLSIDSPTLLFLVEHGFLETRRVKNASSRVTNKLVTVGSYEAFLQEYCTLGMLRRYCPGFRTLQQSQLQKMGVMPVVEFDGIRRIYRKADLPSSLQY